MKVFSLVLLAVITLASATSQARDIQPSITAQFCANQLPCQPIERSIRLVRVDLEDGNDSRVLVFKDQFDNKIRIAYPSHSRAVHVRMMAENNGLKHIFFPAVEAADNSVIVYEEADVLVVQRSLSSGQGASANTGRAN
jgi:hypothetical protein